MTTTITVYAILALASFVAYRREPLKTRIALAVIAPVLLVVAAVMWAVSRLEEIG